MNFRAIRIAITLSLIVAMTSQPVVGIGFARGNCNSQSDQQINCQGCGCCEIKQAGDRCCCCKSEADQRAVEVPHATGDGATADGTIATDCRCGISTPPMDRRQQRESTVDLSKLRKGSLHLVELLAKSDPKSFRLHPGWRGDSGRLGRYSQRYLCIWRI